MKKLLYLTFVALCLNIYAQVNVKSIDQYIEKARQEWNVPGMAVAIVKDGKVVLSKGYGVKQISGSDKVDDNTLFAIASNTKAFVASCLARLVEEGMVDWKDKVREYLPYFTLYNDEYISSIVTIEDLLCHRVGLGTFSGDVIWYKSEKSPEIIIKQAAYVPQAFELRDGYGYSNLMFITAGEIIRKVTGQPWEAYVTEHFLEPLEMNNTVISVDDLPENVATPHKPTIDKGTIPIKWASWNAPSAAGGIISSADDMAKWMLMNLNGGEWKDKKYVAKEQQNLLWTPHVSFKLSEKSKEALPGRHFVGYGLGWSLMDYHGNLMASHGGGYDGMYSRVVMVPDQKLGVVVLTNTMEGISFPLAMYVVNMYLKKDMRDWSAEYLKRARSRNKHKEEVEERKNAHRLNTNPTVGSEEVQGSYIDPMYGTISVVETNGQLRIHFQDAPLLSATLKHWHYDTYELQWDEEHAWFDFGTVSFTLDNNLKVTGMEFDVPNGDIFFDELHPKKVKDGKGK